MGAGAWGRNIVQTLGELGHLAGVCDPSEACLEVARKLVGEKARGVRWTSRAEEILRDPEMAGVMVATPAETHYEVGKKILAAGKDLFVEKPLTVGLKEGEKLVKAAEAAGKLLMVGHLLEYHPAILKLHQLIQEEELGEILISSIDRDGMMQGYDLGLLARVKACATRPVIALGGAGHFQHLAEVLASNLAHAVACASLFHFGDNNPIRARAYLKNQGLPVKYI